MLSWAVLVACPLLRAQSTFGTVLGTVTDAFGGRDIGRPTDAAEYRARNLCHSRLRRSGFFESLNLAPGRFQASAEWTASATQSSAEFILEARETRRADF